MKQSFNRPASGGTEEMKMLKLIRALFATPPAQPEEPKFLLPETAEEYRQRRDSLNQARTRRRQAEEAEADRLDREAAELSAQVATPAAVELNRREASKLRAQAERGRRHLVLLQRELEKELNKLPPALRKKEAELLAHQGEIVKQTFDDSAAERERLCFSGDPAYRRERRLVRYEGRTFLVQLTWYAVTRTVYHQHGGKYGDPYERYVPTGEWKPPVADWATDSVSQMSDEELKAIL